MGWYSCKNGVLISNSDLDYIEKIFGNLVNQYNADQLELDSGVYVNLSGVIGLDFYHYRKSHWIQSYDNILPIHKPIQKAVKKNILMKLL